MRLAGSLRSITMLAALGSSTLAAGHPTGDLAQVRLTTAEWAAAIQSENEDSMDQILAPDFASAGVPADGPGADEGRKSYIASLGKFPITKVIWRYSEYKITGDTAEVGPIVIYPLRQFKNPVAIKLKMREIGDNWKIVAIEPGGEVPTELLPTKLPLQSVLFDLPISLRDKTSGKPISARVHIEDADGTYWPPQGHMNVIPRGWREDIGGDVIIGGKTFAYVQSDFIAALPVGRYKMEVARGLEYRPLATTFEVKAGSQISIGLELERWTSMKDRGWFSGDTHVHFLDPQTALLEAQGEDLNVINVLASSGGDLITSVNHFTGAPSVHSSDENIVYINEETRHDYLGHTTLLGLKRLIYPMGWGAPTTGVPNGYDNPTMADQADKAHAAGGTVIWAHFPDPGGEVPIDFNLGKIDGAEVAVFGNPFSITRDENPGPMIAWYRLLNTGSKVPGLGATDKMWNTQKVGGVRTYVKVDGPLTYSGWIDGIRKGRTFVTSGPMISLSVADHEIGDAISLRRRGKLPYIARAWFERPVDRLEIVVNGKVVASVQNPEKKNEIELSGQFDFPESAWIAARVVSDENLPIQSEYNGPKGVPVFAHTSPIYIDVAEMARKSPEDAAYLRDWCWRTVDWARSHARYPNEQVRSRVVDQYSGACLAYDRQAKGKP